MPLGDTEQKVRWPMSLGQKPAGVDCTVEDALQLLFSCSICDHNDALENSDAFG